MKIGKMINKLKNSVEEGYREGIYEAKLEARVKDEDELYILCHYHAIQKQLLHLKILLDILDGEKPWVPIVRVEEVQQWVKDFLPVLSSEPLSSGLWEILEMQNPLAEILPRAKDKTIDVLASDIYHNAMGKTMRQTPLINKQNALLSSHIEHRVDNVEFILSQTIKGYEARLQQEVDLIESLNKSRNSSRM